MVQLKYFGDDRDFFKYDLITFILKKSRLSNYVFIPMLTEHRNDNEGQKTPADKNDRSHELLQFMLGCPSKSLKHWENWISHFADQYLTVEPVDSTYFHDSSRMAYWEKFNTMLPTKNALIFIDPDTGLETGSPAYQKRQGREKYLINNELSQLVHRMDNTSVLMIYQHLSRNSNDHDAGVQKKISQVIGAAREDVLVCAYRENDLSFLFVMKMQEQYKEVFRILNGYHEKSTSAYKSIYGTPYVKGSSVSYIHSVETGIDNETLEKESPEKENMDNVITDEETQGEDLTYKDEETGKKVLRDKLNFNELRKALKKVLSDRLKDTASVHKMLMEKYGEVNKISPSYLRQDKHTRQAVADAFIGDMSNDDLVNLLWENGGINPDRTISQCVLYSDNKDNDYIIERIIGQLDRPKTKYWHAVFWGIWPMCFVLTGNDIMSATPEPFKYAHVIMIDILLFALILYKFCNEVSIGFEYAVSNKKKPLFPLWNVHEGGNQKYAQNK